MEDPLRIGRHAAIPLSEIELRASRSSGPGGQHANVTASRVEAVFEVGASGALSEEQRNRIAARLGPVVRAVATRAGLRILAVHGQHQGAVLEPELDELVHTKAVYVAARIGKEVTPMSIGSI